MCKQSETVASCCMWWRERPSGTGPLRTRWYHVAYTGSSVPMGRTPATCQPTDNPPETATVGTGGWGGKWEREKKENGGRRGKRRGRTLAARKLNAELFYTVFALCFVLFTKLPLSLSALVLFSVFLRHTHIHIRYTHTHKIFLEAIDTVVLVSPLSALGLLRVAEAQPPLCQCHLSPKQTQGTGAKLCWRPHLKELLKSILRVGQRIHGF